MQTHWGMTILLMQTSQKNKTAIKKLPDMTQTHKADFVTWIWYFSVIKKQDTESNNIGFDPTVTIIGMRWMKPI